MIMLLTAPQLPTIIVTKLVILSLEYSCKSMRRFEPRKNNGAGYAPLGAWLFLCPKSLLSTLKNLPLWWGGLLEQLRYAAVQADMNSHRPKIEPLRGGLSLNNGASQ